ncbi:vasopressin V2 receptor-like [Heterodontus francisci]|uniref:vasopressin V2 receptor-like n=1 Tax=Heterodontus francisci TaxID=7792 RepID=UPI00355B3950
MKNLSVSLNESDISSGRSRWHVLLNGTGTWETLGIPERDEQLAKAEVAVLGIIFVAATVGNSVLIRVLWRKKRMSRMYVFVMHLSIADLVVAVFQVLPQLIWDITEIFLGPDVLCRAVAYLQLVGMFASTYMMVVMTVDRFQAVCYPMVTFQKKKAYWNTAICTSWALSLILSIPQVFIFSKTEVAPGLVQCWAEFIQPWGLKAYVTWIFLVIFFIPTVVLTMCQVKIYRVIRLNIYTKTHQGSELTETQTVHSRASNVNCISKAMNKTVKMAVVTVLAYVLCWAPYFTVQLYSAWYPSDISQGAVFTILMLLGNLNSCANPWIYMYFCGQIPCRTKHQSHCSVRKESAVTTSINLADKDAADAFTMEPIVYFQHFFEFQQQQFAFNTCTFNMLYDKFVLQSFQHNLLLTYNRIQLDFSPMKYALNICETVALSAIFKDTMVLQEQVNICRAKFEKHCITNDRQRFQVQYIQHMHFIALLNCWIRQQQAMDKKLVCGTKHDYIFKRTCWTKMASFCAILSWNVAIIGQAIIYCPSLIALEKVVFCSGSLMPYSVKCCLDVKAVTLTSPLELSSFVHAWTKAVMRSGAEWPWQNPN